MPPQPVKRLKAAEHETRPRSVGGRDDTKQLRDNLAVGAMGLAMRQINSHGVPDANDSRVVQQLDCDLVTTPTPRQPIA